MRELGLMLASGLICFVLGLSIDRPADQAVEATTSPKKNAKTSLEESRPQPKVYVLPVQQCPDGRCPPQQGQVYPYQQFPPYLVRP